MLSHMLFWPIAGGLAGLAFFALLIGGAVVVFSRIFAGTGAGWGRLAPRYAVAGPPAAGYLMATGRTIQVGAVVAKRCARIGVGAPGLYLQVPWRKPLLIPWSEFLAIEPARLHLRPAHRITIGPPPVAFLTVFPEDFAAMRPYLERGRSPGRVEAQAPATPAGAP